MGSLSRALSVCVVLGVCVAVTACTTADYSDGVSSFSQAVSQANMTEQTLATSEQKVALANYIQHSAGQTAVVDLNKCRGNPGPYKAGDCNVEMSNIAPPSVEPSSLTGVIQYSALLSAVISDKTCASLQSDASSLASSIGDMAKDAKAPGLANAVGPLTSITSTLGCLAITDEQLSILREATKDANPIVQKLVPIIAQKDQDMYASILETDIAQLNDATASYATSKSASDLSKIVSLTQAVDSAQSSQPGALITKLASLHQTLTDDLAAPTVNLKNLESDAQGFSADAKTVEAAIGGLADPTSAPAATRKSAK
jgi:hypothetical protein